MCVYQLMPQTFCVRRSPSRRPSCCPGRFCLRPAELSPPLCSHVQSGVYSEHQDKDNSIVKVSLSLGESPVGLRTGECLQTPAVSRSSRCAAEHVDHLGNAAKQIGNGPMSDLILSVRVIIAAGSFILKNYSGSQPLKREHGSLYPSSSFSLRLFLSSFAEFFSLYSTLFCPDWMFIFSINVYQCPVLQKSVFFLKYCIYFPIKV